MNIKIWYNNRVLLLLFLFPFFFCYTVKQYLRNLILENILLGKSWGPQQQVITSIWASLPEEAEKKWMKPQVRQSKNWKLEGNWKMSVRIIPFFLFQSNRVLVLRPSFFQSLIAPLTFHLSVADVLMSSQKTYRGELPIKKVENPNEYKFYPGKLWKISIVHYLQS